MVLFLVADAILTFSEVSSNELIIKPVPGLLQLTTEWSLYQLILGLMDGEKSPQYCYNLRWINEGSGKPELAGSPMQLLESLQVLAFPAEVSILLLGCGARNGVGWNNIFFGLLPCPKQKGRYLEGEGAWRSCCFCFPGEARRSPCCLTAYGVIQVLMLLIFRAFRITNGVQQRNK